MTTCWVADADYRRHFKGEVQAGQAPAVPYSGEDRRTAKIPRRGIPDRRWESANGRRVRLNDRRQRKEA